MGCDCLSRAGVIYSRAMGEESESTERKRNIWAPWRIEYINGLQDEKEGACFLCRYRQCPSEDEENLVLWRGRSSFAVLNRFPYTGGHSMVAPYDHVASLDDLDAPAMLEIMEMIRELRKLLTGALRAEGFNIGMNIGRCAGAGLPDHLHVHVVPRWGGDTNFMAILGDVRVIPQTLSGLYAQLRAESERLGLPKLSS